MKTIQMKVDDNSFDIVMTLLNNLKSGIVTQLKVIEDVKIKNELLEVSKELNQYKKTKKADNARDFLNEL